MQKAIEVTDQNIDEILSNGLPVLLDFWAEWCPPCKAIGPLIDAMAEEYEGKVLIGKVDVDSNPNVTIRFAVRSAPTFLVLKDGKVVEKQVGTVPKATLVQKIEPYILSA